MHIVFDDHNADDHSWSSYLLKL